MSNFSQRADSAAEKLKASMGLPVTKVDVDSTGKQKQEPPPGSYAAMAIEKQRIQAEQNRMPAQQPDAIPVAPPRQEALPTNNDAQPEEQQSSQEGSPRVQQRFSELAAARRDAERQKQEAEAKREEAEDRLQQREREVESLRQEREQLATERSQLLQQQLENLDPETRARVIAEGRTRELLAESEKRILSYMEKPLQELRDQTRHKEYLGLADRYPGFDMDVHGPLIESFQKRNPACTAEQAFRAVAEDHELGSRSSPPKRQVPPVVAPRSTRGTDSYVPAPQNPEQDENVIIANETAEIGKLGSSSNPADKRKARQLIDQNIMRRYGGRFPAKK